MKNGFAVAIDGPAGSGKSSIASALSQRFNLIHFDSGACYRAVAFYFLTKGIRDIQRIEQTVLPMMIQLTFHNGSLYLNGRKVGEEIRTPDVSRFTSDISTLKTVRDFVTASIREMVKGHQVIMEGRDIGSVVLPHADIKIYLTASAEERAKRRLKDWQENGEHIDLQAVIKEIERRDKQDSNRSLAPLKPAEDATLLDTTSLSFHEVVEEISQIILKKKGDSGFYKKS